MKPNYVILSHGRAGTNYCAHNMQDHPEIAAFLEPFNGIAENRTPLAGEVWDGTSSAIEFARRQVFDNPALQDKARGFKLFYFHCRQNRVTSDIWRALRQDKSIKIIFLNRRNFLNKYLSDQRAQASGVWHPNRKDYLTSQYADVVDLRVDIPACLNMMNYLYTSYNLIRQEFDGHDHIEWFYEDLAGQGDAFMADIYRLLEVAPLPAKVPFRAGTLSRATTRIVNHDRVLEVIGSSIFADQIAECPLLKPR
jgi:hypothetical protein